MNCRYYYKGREFKSELALDDFLLTHKPFEPIFGDLVFSLTALLIQTVTKLSAISLKTKQAVLDYLEWKKTVNNITEDGEISYENRPYIGVNKFLSGLKIDDKLLFPEFRELEYWDLRFSDWKVGKFTEDEILEFGIDKNNPPKITDSKQQKILLKLMETRWEKLADIGSAIHSALNIIFSRVSLDSYVVDLLRDTVKAQLLSKLSEKYKNLLLDKTLDLIIDYATNLKHDIDLRFGPGCLLYSEFPIVESSAIMQKGGPEKLFGIIDLLIVDKNGKSHVLDFKTSVRDFSDYVDAKMLSITYLLATYQRMLVKSGVDAEGGDVLVSHILLDNFRKSGDEYLFNGISNTPLISVRPTSEKIWFNIDLYMPAPFNIQVTSDDLVLKTMEFMTTVFPEYTDRFKVTRESVIEYLKANDKLTPNENNIYVYEVRGKNAIPITAKEESEFIDKVLKYEESKTPARVRETLYIKGLIKRALEHGINNVSFPTPNGGVDKMYVTNILRKYCNLNWQVVDNPLLEQFGILTLQTKSAPLQIDFIRITTNFTDSNYRKYLKAGNPLKQRILLTGAFEPDVALKSKPDNLMMEATNGNIELMEMMFILNNVKGLEGKTIGNLAVIDTRHGGASMPYNELLLYSFNLLGRFVKINNNKYVSGEIKLASRYLLLVNRLEDILNIGEATDWSGEYKKIQIIASAVPECLLAIDGTVEDKIRAILKLIATLKSDTTIAKRLSKIYTSTSELVLLDVDIYNHALLALALLKNMPLQLQIRDHEAWLLTPNLLKGIQGSNINNPGHLSSDTLNYITTLVTQAYLNVRDDVLRDLVKIRELTDKLKEEKGMSYLAEKTIANQTELYKNMTYTTPNGDWLFKNPNDLLGAEREFLKYLLYKINKNRYPSYSDEKLQQMKATNDYNYYKVPLAVGGLDSVLSVLGIFSNLRSFLRRYSPKNIYKLTQQRLLGLATESELESNNLGDLIYEMSNNFDRGEGEDRVDRINARGILNLEHNLETLLIKHLFSYSLKRNMDEVFPLIKASAVHLGILGAALNKVFTQDLKYQENYIRNKIKNEDLVRPDLKSVKAYTDAVKNAASVVTLAFSPLLLTYQSLQGFWNDISLSIRKPDGTNAFSINNLRDSMKIVYSELLHFSDTPSICEGLNEHYAVNDIDMNTYADKISSGKSGMYNFTLNFAMRFATRPDYYHRMTIVVAKMLNDGCYYAHSIKGKKLVYDWTKDKRFEIFARGDKSHPDYNKQKILYYTVARQFVTEGARNDDGSLFELNMDKPNPLPRAYTSREAESIKDIGDRIYGYYSHEKKAMVNSFFLGSLFMQFKNYWSAKKDQYLEPGGVRITGNWELYQETTIDPITGETKVNKYYYQVDKDGNILFNEPPLTEAEMQRRNIPTIAPFLQWSGIWLEGIIVTLGRFAQNKWDLKKSFNDIWNNPNDKLRLAYRNNLKQLGYDLTLMLFGGLFLSSLLTGWLKDLLAENKKNKDILVGLGLSVANVAVYSLRNSFFDFNMFDSIGGPITSWQPMAFTWTAREISNMTKLITGDLDLFDTAAYSVSALRLIKPTLDAIKPDIFRTKLEGGTFGVEE